MGFSSASSICFPSAATTVSYGVVVVFTPVNCRLVGSLDVNPTLFAPTANVARADLYIQSLAASCGESMNRPKDPVGCGRLRRAG